MLPALVILAVLAIAAALPWSLEASRAAALHLILAVGAAPLILGAMSHFIPVLTRTRKAGKGVSTLPLVALAGGMLAMTSFALPGAALGQKLGAGLMLVASTSLIVWSRSRRGGMLGRPHPCLAWYEAALLCLVLALLAILAAAFWPQYWIALRNLHLHLNTLGFVGLTAFSTLAVLLPTAAGKPDAGAVARLRGDLSWAVLGTCMIAVGAGWVPLLAVLGALVWAVPLVRMAAAWLRLYRDDILAWHGAAPLLAAAFAGFSCSLLVGGAATVYPAASPASVFVVGFMPPLITGAATQLLPVWMRPGPQGEWHARMRTQLGRHGGIRALLFCISGIVAGAGHQWGGALGLATLSWFILQAVAALASSRRFEKENRHVPSRLF